MAPADRRSDTPPTSLPDTPVEGNNTDGPWRTVEQLAYALFEYIG